MPAAAHPATPTLPPVPTKRKLAAAARAILEREGSEAVGVRRVAEATGITPMAFYRHYADRVALLNSIADAGFDELAQRLAKVRAATPERRLLRMLDVYLDFSLENPRLFELMFLERREGARRFPADFGAGRSPTASLFAQVIEEAIAGGYFRKLDVWEILFAAGAQAQGLILLHLGDRIDLTPAQFRALYRRCFRRMFDGFRR